MIVGVPKETRSTEDRVALVPSLVPQLSRAGCEVVVEQAAGSGARFSDAEYQEKDCRIVASRAEVYRQADVVLQLQLPGTGEGDEPGLLAALRSGQVLIGLSDALNAPDRLPALAERGVTAFGMELMPRITRAQSMDVLSAMATVAGYKAVLLAANALPRMFPMLMTAAGTVTPARVLVIGAGVAGLQAIATANRLGAKVEAYDVRPAVKEQVESLGARFVELPIQAVAAEAASGYAQVQAEEFYHKLRELLAVVVGRSDVVITTAAIPGKPAPKLITAEAVGKMAPGSIIVDLAAERGGNCEGTVPGSTVTIGGVTIMGPTKLPATVPYHASQMYAKNVVSFLLHLLGKEKEIKIDTADPITAGTLLVRDGRVVHPQVRALLGLEAPPT